MLLGFVIFYSPKAFSGELSKSLEVRSEPHNARFFLEFDFVQLSRNSASVSGLGLGLAVQYAMNDKFGVIGSFSQASYLSGFANLYREFGVRLVYALTGKLRAEEKKVSFFQQDVFHSYEKFSGGLRIGVTTEMMFLTSTVDVRSLAGSGFFINYEFNVSLDTTAFIGVRQDTLSLGGATAANDLRFTVGIFF